MTVKTISNFALSLIIALACAQASAGVIESFDFEAGDTTGWSSSLITTSPTGEKFLGRFGNGSVTYNRAGIAAYSDLTVEFDLHIINSWDGDGDFCCGPDTFMFQMNGDTLVNDTFSNTTAAGNFGSFAGAPTAINLLGYGGAYGDSTYRFSFTTSVYSSDLNLDFSASGLQALYDESWGIDNVTVTTTPVPAPAGLLLLGLGLISLGARRLRLNIS